MIDKYEAAPATTAAACVHDYVEHGSDSRWNVTVLVCAHCGNPDLRHLAWQHGEHVLNAEQAGRRAALGSPPDVAAAAHCIRTAAEVAMYGGVTSAQILAWAREGVAASIRTYQSRLNRWPLTPRRPGTRWRAVTIGRRPVQLSINAAGPHVSLRVGRIVLALWRSRRQRWPGQRVDLLSVMRLAHGVSVQTWQMHASIGLWPAGTAYSRPGVIRTPYRKGEK